MKTRLRWFLVPLACALALPLGAAETETPPPTTASPAFSRPPATITIDFPGGTVAQLVALIAKDDDAIFNVIGEQKDLATQLPPISVRNVTPAALASALNNLLLRRRVNLQPADARPVIGRGGQPQVNNTYVLLPARDGGGIPEAFDSFQLAPYLEGQSIDDIVTAVRTAWELSPAHLPEALQIKFHPPTKILLVSGPPDSIMIARQVIGSLKRPQEKSSPKPMPDAEPKK